MAKTKEQLEEEKQTALSQRIVPLDLSSMDTEALVAKAKELHDKLYKLESEKYDLDDRYKRQQYDVSQRPQIQIQKSLSRCSQEKLGMGDIFGIFEHKLLRLG